MEECSVQFSWGPLNLGDVKEAYEILVNSQLMNFTENKSGVMFTARNLLISALSDYDSYQEIFWEVIESDFFHCETVGGKAVSPSEKVSKIMSFEESKYVDVYTYISVTDHDNM